MATPLFPIGGERSAPDPRLALEQKRRRREMYIIAGALLALVFLTYLETSISRFSKGLPIANNILVFGLINVNIILLILVIFLVLRNVVKLFYERKQKVLGARLRTKLVVAFVSLSLIPTMLLFFVAGGFITNSIENWFSLEVEQSLQKSLEVAQTYYTTQRNNAITYAHQISRSIAENRLLDDERFEFLEEFVRIKLLEYSLSAVEIYGAQQDELTRSLNASVPVAQFTGAEPGLVEQALRGQEQSVIQPAGEGELIRGVVPIFAGPGSREAVGAVVVNYYVPKSLRGQMQEIAKTFDEYKQLKVLKSPIKSSYLITLLMVTLLIVFAATWYGFYLGRGIIVPIQELAEGTQRVAHGDLDFRIELQAEDEIGTLVGSFNKMTEDLRASKQALERTYGELQKKGQEAEQRRRYMETVLRNVTAGVISVDRDGVITTINKSAERMLEIDAKPLIGRHFREVLKPEHLELAGVLLDRLQAARTDAIEQQVRLTLPGRTLVLRMSLSALRDDENAYLGMVLVFDDLSHLLKAQRMEAWREVARRIAHEVKNPLTPIQLSAQRLRRRYAERLGKDGAVFEECTQTIIQQVDELKQLVNEFSSFARMPAIKPAPHNLNEVIQEALVLYQEGHREITFTVVPDKELPEVEVDRDQIKRVMLNLLDNAVAAIERTGEITVETFFDAPLRMARIEVADTGCGIPPEDRGRLFEPYFSTKKSGTGLGLAIVSSIVADHNGHIRVKDNEPRGTRFIIELPVAREAASLAASLPREG